MKYLGQSISDEHIVELDRVDLRNVFNWPALKVYTNSQYGSLQENTSLTIERILQDGRRFIRTEIKEWLDTNAVDKEGMPLWSIRPSITSYINGGISSIYLTFYRKEHALLFKITYG